MPLFLWKIHPINERPHWEYFDARYFLDVPLGFYHQTNCSGKRPLEAVVY